jgi:hypothetical protein
MKLSKALKLKNKLVADINDTMSYILRNNSQEVTTPRAYSVKEKLKEVETKTAQLVELKASIHKANLPVWDKVFRMSELKGQLAKLKHLDTTERAESPSGVRAAVTAEVTEAEKDQLVKQLQEAIEALQDQLDHHNHTTEV